jgi:hypothetical protein
MLRKLELRAKRNGDAEKQRSPFGCNTSPAIRVCVTSVDNSAESLFVKRSVRSKTIYLVVVFSVAATIVALPFIYVQISTQARGVIRTLNENN